MNHAQRDQEVGIYFGPKIRSCAVSEPPWQPCTAAIAIGGESRIGIGIAAGASLRVVL